jgi:hypothetical protein
VVGHGKALTSSTGWTGLALEGPVLEGARSPIEKKLPLPQAEGEAGDRYQEQIREEEERTREEE